MRSKAHVARKHVARVVVGLVVLAAIEVLVYSTGGPRVSPVYPLLYVWIAFLAGIVHPSGAMAGGGGAIGLETPLREIWGKGPAPLPAIIAPAGFRVLSPPLFSSLPPPETRHAKKKADDAVRDALERV